MMFKKKCVVCGKEFEARQSNYSLCSDECRKIRKRSHTIKRMNDPVRHEQYLKKYKEKRAMKNVPCRICGENVPSIDNGNRMNRKFYHDDCIANEALKAISEGKNCEDKRIRRAYNRGYTIKELKECGENGKAGISV